MDIIWVPIKKWKQNWRNTKAIKQEKKSREQGEQSIGGKKNLVL